MVESPPRVETATRLQLTPKAYLTAIQQDPILRAHPIHILSHTDQYFFDVQQSGVPSEIIDERFSHPHPGILIPRESLSRVETYLGDVLQLACCCITQRNHSREWAAMLLTLFPRGDGPEWQAASAIIAKLIAPATEDMDAAELPFIAKQHAQSSHMELSSFELTMLRTSIEHHPSLRKFPENQHDLLAVFDVIFPAEPPRRLRKKLAAILRH